VQQREAKALRPLDDDMLPPADEIAQIGRGVTEIGPKRYRGAREVRSGPMPTDGAKRERYFQALAEKAGPDTLVFLDPDNGLEVRSVSASASGAERYLFWHELRLLRDAGSSLLIYQHFPRVQRAPYLKERLTRLRGELGDSYETFAAYTSQVGFLFGLRREHPALRDAVAARCANSPLLSYVD